MHIYDRKNKRNFKSHPFAPFEVFRISSTSKEHIFTTIETIKHAKTDFNSKMMKCKNKESDETTSIVECE